MNKRKQYIYIGLISILILIIGFLYLNFHPSLSPLSRGEVQKGPKTLSETLFSKNIKVSLIIQDKKYETEMKEGETVFDLMKKVKEENNKFDFKYIEHTGLGVFINEINGLKGGGDGYWIYSVDEVEASIGVSNYKIKNGDIISWKYEK